MQRNLVQGMVFIIVLIGLLSPAQAGSDPRSRTESNCNIGMKKGDQGKTCDVPVPDNCSVATYPGYEDPWAEVTKGGNIQCRFDEKNTDWKTRIRGVCGKCATPQCSARFSVMFNCSSNVPSASPRQPSSK